MRLLAIAATLALLAAPAMAAAKLLQLVELDRPS